MINLTFGCTQTGKYVMLYCGTSLQAAKYAQDVALLSGAYCYVDLFPHQIAAKIFDHESIKL
jgi:hypothetical protein